MVADIEAMAGVHLGPGTLYGALSRPEEQGPIEALPGEGRRRPYRITGTGARVLGEQLRTISAVAETGPVAVAPADTLRRGARGACVCR